MKSVVKMLTEIFPLTAYLAGSSSAHRLLQKPR